MRQLGVVRNQYASRGLHMSPSLLSLFSLLTLITYTQSRGSSQFGQSRSTSMHIVGLIALHFNFNDIFTGLLLVLLVDLKKLASKNLASSNLVKHVPPRSVPPASWTHRPLIPPRSVLSSPSQDQSCTYSYDICFPRGICLRACHPSRTPTSWASSPIRRPWSGAGVNMVWSWTPARTRQTLGQYCCRHQS